MTIIGEYTGELMPKDPHKPDERTQYLYEINFSDVVEGDDPQARCWLDATKTGSVFRFMNHSCSPNAIKDEDITINYGSKWFSTPEEPCSCGSSECINPLEDDTRKETGKERANLSKAAKEGKDTNQASKSKASDAEEPEEQHTGNRTGGKFEKSRLSTETKEKVVKGVQKQDAVEKKEREDRRRPLKAREEETRKLQRQEEATQTGDNIGNAEKLRRVKSKGAGESKPPPGQRRTSPRLVAASASSAGNKAVEEKPPVEDSDDDEEVRAPKEIVAQREALRETSSSPRRVQTFPTSKTASRGATTSTQKIQDGEDLENGVKAPPEKNMEKKDATKIAKEQARKRPHEEDEEEPQFPKKKATKKKDVKNRN